MNQVAAPSFGLLSHIVCQMENFDEAVTVNASVSNIANYMNLPHLKLSYLEIQKGYCWNRKLVHV